MAVRNIEIVVDQWPIGPRNEIMMKGERVFIDEKAAHILVGMGKAMYVDDKAGTADEAPQQRSGKRRYNRRDMRPAD